LVATIASGGPLDEKNIFDSKGHTKAKGLRITLEYPSTWQAQEGRRPNIIQRFSPQKRKGEHIETTLLIKEIPSSIDFTEHITNEMLIKGLLSEAASDSNIDVNTTTIDAESAGWAIFTKNINHAGLALKMKGVMYAIIYEGKIITFTASVGGLQSDNTIDQKFDLYLPVFKQIAGSIIFPSKWQ